MWLGFLRLPSRSAPSLLLPHGASPLVPPQPGVEEGREQAASRMPLGIDHLHGAAEANTWD